MKELLKDKQIIKIIPENVTFACSAVINECSDEEITAQCIKDNAAPEGECECFTVTDAGVVYFKSKIKENEQKSCKISIPAEYTVLQRREYTRIPFKQSALLSQDDTEYNVLITDISAGGMKVFSEKEIKISGEYKAVLNLGNNNLINIRYAPIRQERNSDNSFLISGKFENISHKDRIALIRYCFSRQMEGTNK